MKSPTLVALWCMSAYVAGASITGEAAQIVTYSGKLTLAGVPVNDGFLIAGTFNPAFDPFNYKYVYGSNGNLLESNYSQVVADGNFIPIGSGAVRPPVPYSSVGWSGSGLNTAPPGALVWLFAFNARNPDHATVFALATNPNWITSNDPLNINGADATSFVFGQRGNGAIELQVLPFPEPGSLALCGIAFVLAGASHRMRAANKMRRPAPQKA